MKKLYMLGVFLVAASTAWCTLQAPTIPELSTGAVMTWTESTGAELTGIVTTWSAMEEFTWAFDSGVVAVVTGSEGVDINTGVSAEVQKLIDERKTQSGDEKKLTEEDIGLYEKIINIVQKLGK